MLFNYVFPGNMALNHDLTSELYFYFEVPRCKGWSACRGRW